MNDYVHSVIFTLKHPKGSAEEFRFLDDAREILTAIPGVRGFEVLRQVSPKNDYDFGFTMVFSGAEQFEAYNVHPLHVDFVEKRWLTEVERFLEIDYVGFEPSSSRT